MAQFIAPMGIFHQQISSNGCAIALQIRDMIALPNACRCAMHFTSNKWAWVVNNITNYGLGLIFSDLLLKTHDAVVSKVHVLER